MAPFPVPPRCDKLALMDRTGNSPELPRWVLLAIFGMQLLGLAALPLTWACLALWAFVLYLEGNVVFACVVGVVYVVSVWLMLWAVYGWGRR